MSTTCFKPWTLFLLHAKEGQASPIYKMQSQTSLEDGKAMGDQMAQAKGSGLRNLFDPGFLGHAMRGYCIESEEEHQTSHQVKN